MDASKVSDTAAKADVHKTETAAPTFLGTAMFSTRFGELALRSAFEPKCGAIVRSAPAFDSQKAAEHYQNLYPKQCRDILHNFKIQDWFDEHDIHLHGSRFVWNVLYKIATKNTADMDDFNVRWSSDNFSRLPELCEAVTIEQIFEHAERQEYGDIFLDCALKRMRHSLQQLSQLQGKLPSDDQTHETTQSLWSEDEQTNQARMEQMQSAQEAVRTALTTGQGKHLFVDDMWSRSDAETSTSADLACTKGKTPRRSSFHGISRVPAGEFVIPRNRPVATEAPTPQQNEALVPQVPQNVTNQIWRERLQEPRPSSADVSSRTAGMAPTTSKHSSQYPEGSTFQRPPLRPVSQGRRPSSNLRVQVMEGTEQPRATPYRSLNEVVHQQAPAFGQLAQGGLQNSPVTYTVDGRLMMPSGRATQPHFQPSLHAPGFLPFSPSHNQTISPAHSRQMTPVPHLTPFQLYGEQFEPGRLEHQPSHTYDGPSLYSTRSLPPDRYNAGARREKLPKQWLAQTASHESSTKQMQHDYKNQNQPISPVFYPYGGQGKGITRKDSNTTQRFHRSRSDSVEPFPPFYDPTFPPTFHQTDHQLIGSLNLEDFTCTSQSIGRLREDVCSLWVADFPEEITNDMLANVFDSVAQIRAVHMKGKRRFNDLRFGFIDFTSGSEARKALSAYNEGRLRLHFPMDVRVPEQHCRNNHPNYMPPEVYAAQYQISMREGLSTLPPPGSPWLGRRLSSSFQQGRESNYRRSFGSSGRRASFGRHSRVEEQKTREGYRRYSPQDARSGDLHGSQIVMNKLSISEDVNQEPNTTEPTNSDKLKESTRSSKSSGGVTPKRKKKGRLGNESFTQSPTKTIRQETSGCTSDTVTSSQSSRDQGNLSKGPGSGIIADPGATAIVEEPLSIPEENDPDLTNSTTEDENVPSSFGPVDYESKLKGEPTIPWSSGDITIQELRASSTEISHTAESEDSPFALSKTPTRMTETLKHGATAQITGQMVASSTIAPAESEMRDTRAESRVDKAVFAVDTGAGLIDAASNIQVEHASQPTSETQFTSLELGKELFQASRVDFEPADVPMQRKTNSGVVSSKKIVGTGLEVTAPQPKANPLVHKQGPAQTESLSPFGRKKPVKQQAKKESKKKNKLKGKGKGKAQLSAPTAPSDPVSESSRGSRAVSSDSYHTADEPDNDRFEDGKSDDAVLQGDSSDTLQGDVSGTTSGLQTATDVGSPALSVAGRQDSMFATDPEPPDNIEDGAGVMSSAVAMAVQLHDRGRDEITEKVLATVTNVLAASRDESPKTESGGGQDYQNDPSSTTGSRGEPHPLLHHVPHAATSEAQKAEPPSTYTGSPHSHDSSPESSGVVITTVQPSTSMPVVSEKRRPPRLELSDITNLSSASGKAPAKEAARNTSPSVQRSPPPNPGTEETATTPPQKKKRNTQKKKKKQRVSEESETSKTEGSPGSAQYSVPSTSYPPLHHAASTTVVGIWSASATKSLQPSANTEKATVSEGLASLDTAKSVQGYSSQKSPTISEERGKDQQQSIQGEYEESVGKVQKQSLEEQGSRPSVTTSESSTVEIEETFEPLGNISGTRVLTDEVYAADPIRSEDTIYGEQTGRSEEMCVSGMEKKKNNPWATSPMIPKVPFHAIQADDEAKKEEEKAEKLRTKGQKGKESAAEVAVEEKSEMEREITGTAQEAEWTKVEKGKAPAKKLYKGWETQNQGKVAGEIEDVKRANAFTQTGKSKCAYGGAYCKR